MEQKAGATVRIGGEPLGTVESTEVRLRALPLRDLITELAKKGSQLVRKEVELAKAEAREDLRSELRMAKGLGVAGVCALLTVQMLLVAIAFALMEADVVPGWAASLIVAVVVLAVGTAAGLWGWAKRVRNPLDATRSTVRDNFRWAKEQLA
jgi:uncharacterized membrane protein YqjE